jgi:hypothetical protein
LLLLLRSRNDPLKALVHPLEHRDLLSGEVDVLGLLNLRLIVRCLALDRQSLREANRFCTPQSRA